MDDRQRDREAGQPDPTHDTWSAWLPQLDPPTSPLPQEPGQPEPEQPESAVPPVPPAPPTPPGPPKSAPRLPQASLPPPTTRPAPNSAPPPRTYAASSAGRAQPDPLGSAPPPANHLGAAILCTIVCFMPFGIVALVKAVSVNSLWALGRVDAAHRASRSARNWCLLAALVWPVVPVLAFGLFILVGMAMSIG